MKKLTILFAALTLSVGLWAETVAYLDPVYNDPTDVTKGIKEWKNATADATVVTDASEAVTWGTAGQTTWFVVNSDVTISQRVTCQGDVHLILANGVTLNATQGITVTGTNSFTIYAQTEDLTQMGRLIADASDAGDVAGIGGGSMGDNGSNITINGGEVTANGGNGGAGIGGGNKGSGSYITINGGNVQAFGGNDAAGIGGGNNGSGSYITINGGTVEATGGNTAAGIGGGNRGSGSYITINGGTVTAACLGSAAGIGDGFHGNGSNIFVATKCIVKADNNNPPTTVIANTGSDLASSLAGKRYATVETLATPEEGEDFEDATSGLYFMVTAVGETNTVMVIPKEYSGIAYTVPATVMYKNVTFNVTEIDENAFAYSSDLQSIIISEGVTTIGRVAFFECTSLQSVTLPESVTTIGEEAFYNCTSLQSITIPAGVTTIELSTFASSGLQSVTISEGVTTIGGSAFEGCSSLQSVTLPESVTTIEAYAFASSGLQSITIPANVTEIGEKAFMECSNLTDIYVAWTTKLPTMGTNVFQDVPNTATLYVPFGSKALYQADNQWNTFTNIVEYDPFVDIRTAALVEITTARQGIQNTNINNKIDAALRDIQSAITKEEIERIKNEILEVINAFKAGHEDGKAEGDAAGYARGKEEGKAEGLAEAQAALPTEGTSGPAVVITQGDKSITLINPDEVKYTIITEE